MAIYNSTYIYTLVPNFQSVYWYWSVSSIPLAHGMQGVFTKGLVNFNQIIYFQFFMMSPPPPHYILLVPKFCTQ